MSVPQSPLSQFSRRRIALPIAIGVAVSVYLLFGISRIDVAALREIALSKHLLLGLIFALATVAVRDLAYIYRIRRLTGEKLSWRKCFEVIFLWEFGSSVTPASVGGITLALFILKKEHISYGKGTAVIMLCSYLDNIAFVTVFALLYLAMGPAMFDLSASCGALAESSAISGFRAVGQYVWIGFLVVAVIGGLLGFAIFVRPHWARGVVRRVAGWSWLNRWHAQLELLGDEIENTSKEFKHQGKGFLISVLMATIVSWCARYALANAILWTFSDGEFSQLAVFARQYVHRVIVMIPTTPGGSGLAEWSFIAMNCEFMKEGLAGVIATVWRLFNFYFYIAMGLLILPGWLRRVREGQ
ncbi:MAG: lysylphosphatidylglycerol synthase transmembrane domain-containing protein [Chitinophagales bacterium]